MVGYQYFEGVDLMEIEGFSQSPIANTTYYASCEIANCKSTRVATHQVNVNSTSSSLTANISSGTSLFQSTQTLIASNKVSSPANVTYKAGNSITLNTGFEAQNGSIFLAQIQGCN